MFAAEKYTMWSSVDGENKMVTPNEVGSEWGGVPGVAPAVGLHGILIVEISQLSATPGTASYLTRRVAVSVKSFEW